MTRITLLIAALLCLPAQAAPSKLSKNAVLSVMKKGMPGVLACGEDLVEDVKVRFTITKQGHVRSVKVQGKHAKDDVGRCMKQRIAALKFPASAKATPVTFPFRFGASVAAQPALRPNKLARKDLDGLLDILEDDLKRCGEGEVTARFQIQPTGKAGDVQVVDTDEQTSACVSKRISRVRFPTAAEPTPVERTFSLDEG